MYKKIVGLTGQSGAGKTTVSFLFETNDFFIINTDKIARQLQSEPFVIEILKNNFGDEVVTPDKALDRKQLARIVFSDKKELEKLNSIMFPLVIDKVKEIILDTEEPLILLDAPQLFESGVNCICDTIVAVICSKNKLIERIVERDNITVENAKLRLNSQKTEKFFIDNADYVIQNNSDIENLIRETDNIINLIKNE